MDSLSSARLVPDYQVGKTTKAEIKGQTAETSGVKYSQNVTLGDGKVVKVSVFISVAESRNLSPQALKDAKMEKIHSIMDLWQKAHVMGYSGITQKRDTNLVLKADTKTTTETMSADAFEAKFQEVLNRTQVAATQAMQPAQIQQDTPSPPPATTTPPSSQSPPPDAQETVAPSPATHETVAPSVAHHETGAPSPAAQETIAQTQETPPSLVQPPPTGITTPTPTPHAPPADNDSTASAHPVSQQSPVATASPTAPSREPPAANAIAEPETASPPPSDEASATAFASPPTPQASDVPPPKVQGWLETSRSTRTGQLAPSFLNSPRQVVIGKARESQVHETPTLEELASAATAPSVPGTASGPITNEAIQEQQGSSPRTPPPSRSPSIPSPKESLRSPDDKPQIDVLSSGTQQIRNAQKVVNSLMEKERYFSNAGRQAFAPLVILAKVTAEHPEQRNDTLEDLMNIKNHILNIVENTKRTQALFERETKDLPELQQLYQAHQEAFKLREEAFNKVKNDVFAQVPKVYTDDEELNNVFNELSSLSEIMNDEEYINANNIYMQSLENLSTRLNELVGSKTSSSAIPNREQGA